MFFFERQTLNNPTLTNLYDHLLPKKMRNMRPRTYFFSALIIQEEKLAIIIFVDF